MLHLAHNEGLISNHSNMHLGSRSTLSEKDYDLENDARCGFSYIRAREIDEMGIDAIVQRVVERVGDKLVYLSVDIDVLDPSTAPGTGTPEPGGWTTREMIRILRGIEKLNVVGADIVEVSPSYDNKGETTALAAAQVAFEIITSMVKSGAGDVGGWYGRKDTDPQSEHVSAKDEL